MMSQYITPDRARLKLTRHNNSELVAKIDRRERCYFNAAKTVQVGQLPGVCFDAPVQIIEDELCKDATVSARIACCVRNSTNQVLVEFQSSHQRDNGVASGLALVPVRMGIAKQRFIEDDIRQEIRKRMKFMYDLPAVKIRKALLNGQKIPAVRPKCRNHRIPQKNSNHDHVLQAMLRVQYVAAERQLDIGLYRTMFPKAYDQFMAILQASAGDTCAQNFLQSYVPPYQLREDLLDFWGWRHVQLHNEGLEYIRGVIRQMPPTTSVTHYLLI